MSTSLCSQPLNEGGHVIVVCKWLLIGQMDVVKETNYSDREALSVIADTHISNGRNNTVHCTYLETILRLLEIL